MSRRAHALAVFLVMLMVIAACAASLAHAVEAPTNLCGAGSGWAPAKVDGSTSAKPYLVVPAVPIVLADVSGPAPRWAGVEDAAPASWRIPLAQPRAPRAPPLA